MTFLQFLTTINKYHLVTFVAVIYVVFGISDFIRIKVGEKNPNN